MGPINESSDLLVLYNFRNTSAELVPSFQPLAMCLLMQTLSVKLGGRATMS